MALDGAGTALGKAEASGLAPAQPSSGVSAVSRLPLLTRARFYFRIYLIKIGLGLLLRVWRLTATLTRSKDVPTYTKSYAVRPMLENRVFIPNTARAGSRYPVMMVIHGGGFAIGEPSMDDPFNRQMADGHGMVVVSVNYRKAPAHPFPTGVHDCAEIARAVLDDDDIPTDPNHVAVAGFSAGGNLALAVAQLPGLKDRIRSVVPVYPVVEFTGRYKGAYRNSPDGKPDGLQSIGPVFNYAYLPPNQDKSDPLLSPICAGRDQLPQRIFFVGAEYDYLCHEAEVMARKLAGVYDEDKGLLSPDLGQVWERDGIKFRMVTGVIHAWTHLPRRGAEEVARQKTLHDLQAEIAEWVKR